MRRRRPLENGTLMPMFLERNMVTRVEELERAQRELDRLGLTTSAAASAYSRRFLLDGWGEANVSANQAATQMSRFLTSGFLRYAVLARGGVVTGLGLTTNEARTGGTATAEIYVNDVATGVRAILDGSVTVFAWESAGVAFEAGDTISIRLATVSWGPITADLQAMIEVELG